MQSECVSAPEKISVFPNPTNSFIHIFIPNPKTNGLIRLLNLSGQVIQTSGTKPGASATILMPVNNYPAGTYLVEIAGDDGTRQVSKVVIIK